MCGGTVGDTFDSLGKELDRAVENIGDFTVSPDKPKLPNQASPAEIQAEADRKATIAANSSRRARRQRVRQSSLSTGAGLAGNQTSLSSQATSANLG